MVRPTTPKSRLKLWRNDAIQLINDFQNHAATKIPNGEVPWRIGYLSGLTEVRDDGDHYSMQMHQIHPHRQKQRIQIPKSGKPSHSLIQALCWHMDQDVRRYDCEVMDFNDPFLKFPMGEILIDPIMRNAMLRSNMTEHMLVSRICDNQNFGITNTIRFTMRMPIPTVIEVNVKYNEIHARYDLPGSIPAKWSKGTLTIQCPSLPDTILSASRGRLLEDLIDHELIKDSAIKISSIGEISPGKYIIATNAMTAEGMVSAPKHEDIRAAA